MPSIQNLPQLIIKIITVRLLPSRSGGVIFWGHLGLGDQISNAVIIEALLEKHKFVVLPTKQRNVPFIEATFGKWNGILVAPIIDNPKYETIEILKIKLKFMFPVQIIGHHLLALADKLLGDVNLNEKFNYLAGIPREKLVSERLRESCLAWPQEEIPLKPYAFIDHHPNTSREISFDYICAIENRGLDVILNCTNVPLFALVDVLDKASEVHLVASAPLCLALTTGAKCERKYYYRTEGQATISGLAYKDWIEIDARSRIFSQEVDKKRTLNYLVSYIRIRIAKILLGGSPGIS
jgi:hypothetical protein